MPMLQIESESPRDLYVTDRLAAVLSDARGSRRSRGRCTGG